MPVEPAVVLERARRSRAGRPRGRARTRSVRYSSPVVGDGARSPIRRRSQAASNAYSPALTSLSGQLVVGRVLGLDDALHRPELAAHDPPEPVGSAANTVASAIAASSCAARLEHGREVGGRDERHVARQDEDLGRVARARAASAGADRVAGPAWLVLERERPPARRTASRTASTGRRVDDDRAVAIAVGGDLGPRVEHVGQHRPAAQR